MQVTTEDGWSLEMGRYPAHGAPKAAVLLLHAMMVDRRSLDRPRGQGLASTWSHEGFEVFTADHRGHGESGPTPREGGSWTYDDLVRYDVPALVEAVREAVPGQPLFIAGHSLGGHVSAASLGTGACRPVDGLILLSAATWEARLTRSRRIQWSREAIIGAMQAITHVAGRFPARRLGLGPADEATPYVDDLARYTREGWLARDGTDYLLSLANARCPVLGVFAENDRALAPLSIVRSWLEHVGSRDTSFWQVGDGSYGLDRAPGHMGLVTDPHSRPLWVRIARWMEDRCRPSKQ